MTTVLQPTRPGEPGRYRSSAQFNKPRPGPLKTWFAARPAWPLTAMLAGWLAWWLLGFSEYAPVIFAIPMVRTMYLWHARHTRKLKLPPGWALWALFLLICFVSTLALGQSAPNTAVSSASNRLISWALRMVLYLGCTVCMLYAGNLTEKELPRKKLAWLLGLVGIFTVAGGVIGTLAPTIQFTSPLSYLIPQSLQNADGQLRLMLHPSTAQVMSFLGYAEGRPEAPFSFTNMWGNSLGLTLPWLLVAWGAFGNRRQRRITIIVTALAIIPVVYSLDRGLWIGVFLSILYLAIRFAARGKIGMLGVIAGTLALGTLVIVFSPLGHLISDRLAHGKSNNGRTNLSLIAGEVGLSSPFIGYGDTRHESGSAASIAIGPTSNCAKCGYTTIGGNGQLQLMLICTGVLGSALYIGFFGYGFWRYRRDKSPYGLAGLQVFLVGFWFMFVYESVGPPLCFAMLAYALLWRNEQYNRQQAAGLAAADGSAAPPATGELGARTAPALTSQ